MAPYIPSWIQPADPAAMWARGTQLGLQQSELKLRQQQMAQQQQMRQEEGQRQAQQFEMEQALAKERMRVQTQEAQQRAELEEKYFSQAAKLAADKAAAILEYQQDIAAGMDPTKAILKHGPAMGAQAAAESAALRSQYQVEALKQREDNQAQMLKVRQEMQDKMLAQQRELAQSKEEAAALRQDKALEARAEADAGKVSGRERLAYDAAKQTIKSLMATSPYFALPEDRQSARAQTDPGFAAQKAKLDQARAIVQRYMQGSGEATTGDADVDSAITQPAMPQIPQNLLTPDAAGLPPPSVMSGAFAPKVVGDLSQLAGQQMAAPEAAAPAAKRKAFKDASGKTWQYTGDSENPLSDTDVSHWEEQ